MRRRQNFQTMAAVSVLLTVAAESSVARPITYPGGWGAEAGSARGRTYVRADRTISPLTFDKWGVYRSWSVIDIYDTEGVREPGTSGRKNMNTLGLMGTLGYRENFADSQFNLYTWAGLGASSLDGFQGKERPSGWAGLSLDWENRVVLMQYQLEGMITQMGGGETAMKDLSQRLRLGLSGYPAEAGELNTWFMVQVDQRARQNRPLRLTPLVRQTYGKTLWEYGISTQGDVMFTLGRVF